MPFVCDIRVNTRNAVIDVGGKLFINGTEHTRTNLAPVPFSLGPAQVGGSYGIISTRWVYRRGAAGLTGTSAEGNIDTAKFSCGQECFTDFVRSSSLPLYYGAYDGGDADQGGASNELSQFDSAFKALSLGSRTIGGSSPNSGGVVYTFLPSVNNQWAVATNPASSYLDLNRNLSSLGTLTEAGTASNLLNVSSRHVSCPYSGSSWLIATTTPWTSATVGDTYYSVQVYLLNRQTGALVAPTGLTSNLWLSTTVGSSLGNRGGYPSNAIVESTSGDQVSQVYFYYPVMTGTALSIFIGTVGAMNTANPTMSTAVAGNVLTAIGGTPLDTSQVVYPATSTQRMVRCWVFEDAGVRYLCCYVFEPGLSTTVATSFTNLYLWRLDSKGTATFLQRVNLGDRGRVRSILPLSTAQKDIVVVTDNSIQYYSWNSTTNWTFRSSQSVSPREVGIDSLGRVWVVDSNGDFSTTVSQGLYLYEGGGSAANISVIFSSVSYSYTGTPLPASLVVNAYDVNGNRIALAVTLKRDSTNFEFSGGASTVNVVTSVSADTTVPISITGAGRLACLAAPTV